MSIVPDSLALFRHGIDLLQSGERGIRPRLYRRHACPPCLVGKCCGTSRHAELDGRYGHSHSARKVTALVVDCVEHVSPLQLALAPSRPHSEPIWPLPGCSQHRCCRVWRWVAGTRNACLPPLTSRRSDPHAAQVVRIFGCPNRAGVINYTRDGVTPIRGLRGGGVRYFFEFGHGHLLHKLTGYRAHSFNGCEC